MTGFSTIGVIGTGLIGGSIGLRARERGWHVIGYDVDAGGVAEAMACNAIDEIVTRDAIYERSTIVVLAAHVHGTIAELERIAGVNADGASLILDVASVKVPIVRAARGLSKFVATHPMAGGERSGADAANSELFLRKPWFYVSSGRPELDMQAVTFIVALGARPVAVDAAIHDAIVAVTSHLPQVLATLFVGRLNERNMIQSAAPYYGPTARELLRLGGSSLAMWRDILEDNRENIGTELRALATELQIVAAALDRDDTAYIERVFARAKVAEPG